MIRLHPCADIGLLARLDAELFPIDKPPVWEGAHWFVGYDDAEAVAFCGWKPVEHDGVAVGFHYRAGVLPSWRGRGLQCEMIQHRERRMLEAGLTAAVTYTDADNAASMCSLIAEGYRPYNPTPTTVLSGQGRLGRVGFVHWRKDLQA
jgi:GNAT superfamily N-acetyltransferase